MPERNTPARRLRLAILSDRSPTAVARLIRRLQTEVLGATVCAVVSDGAEQVVPADSSRIGAALLRFFHGCSFFAPAHPRFDARSFSHLCQQLGIPLLETPSSRSEESPRFILAQDPDLLIVYAGSLPVWARSLTLRRGLLSVGGELSASDAPAEGTSMELRAVLSHASGQQILHRESLPLHPLDTASSVRWKLNLLARDLLLAALQALLLPARTESPPGQTPGSLPTLPAIPPERFAPPVRQRSLRPAWKLLARTIVFAPLLLVRNWYRRLTSTFPVVILYHHLVSDRSHRMGISTHAFEKQVRYLKQHYRIASLAEGVEMLKSGRVNQPTVVLTFDDGYRDNLICLRAVTEEADIPATLFLCTDHLRSGQEFAHDVRRNERGFFPLDWSQAALMQRSGMTLGSHTRSHFDCGSEDADALRAEIAGSQQDFVAALGAPTPFFSFPWGNPQNMSRPAVELARSVYAHVFSAYGGHNKPANSRNLWHLKRRCHPATQWELELTLQGVLEVESRGAPEHFDALSA